MTEKNEVDFKPRAFLNRTLRYRPILKIVFYISIIIQWIALSYYLAEGISSIRSGLPISQAISIPFLLVLIAWVLFIHLIIQPAIETVIQVTADGFSIYRGKELTKVAFQDIASLNMPSSRLGHLLFNGFFSIQTKLGRTHLFSIAIERSEYILEMLCSMRPDLVSQAQIKELRIRALLMDHNWARIQDNFRQFPEQLIAGFFIFPGMQTVLSYLNQPDPDRSEQFLFLKRFAIYASVSWSIGLLTYFSKSQFFSWKEKVALAVNPNAVVRDLKAELQFRNYFEVFFWTLLLVWAAADWTFNFIS
jgi:hypothetical protein